MAVHVVPRGTWLPGGAAMRGRNETLPANVPDDPDWLLAPVE